MKALRWFYMTPKGYGQNLGHNPGDDVWGINYPKLQTAIGKVLEFYEKKANVSLPHEPLVLLQSNYSLVEWYQNLGECLRQDLARWNPGVENICVVFAQGRGGFAGSPPGIPIVADVCIDAICERFFALLFSETAPMLATAENQTESLAHELGHQWFGPRHIPDASNIMSGGYWTPGGLETDSLNQEQVEQLKAWESG